MNCLKQIKKPYLALSLRLQAEDSTKLDNKKLNSIEIQLDR